MWRLRKGEETHVSALGDWRHCPGMMEMLGYVWEKGAGDKWMVENSKKRGGGKTLPLTR